MKTIDKSRVYAAVPFMLIAEIVLGFVNIIGGVDLVISERKN